MNDKPNILIVDDEAPICQLLTEELGDRGFCCAAVQNAAAALAKLAEQKFDAVLLDIMLPDISGVDLLQKITATFPTVAPIMLTAVDDLNVAVQTMKYGALDFIPKPFDFDRLEHAIRLAMEKKAKSLTSPALEMDAEFNGLEAIARGVETRQDLLDVHSEKVIQQTATTARALGISEETIKKWIAARAEKRNKSIQHMADSISKLGGIDK
jgi:DNA-binding NtrC family response regulator